MLRIKKHCISFVVVLICASNTIFAQKNDAMEKEMLMVDIYTPTKYNVRCQIILGKITNYLENNQEVIVKAEKNERNRNVLYLKSGKIIFESYSGWGFLFNSFDDYQLCLNKDYYYELFMAINKDNQLEHYYFELKDEFTKLLIENKQYDTLTDKESSDGTSLRLEDNSFLFLFKPHLNYGYWFSSEKMFNHFYDEFHGIGANYEPTREDEVDKLLFINKKEGFINIKRLSESKFNDYAIEISEKRITQFNLEDTKSNFEVYTLKNKQQIFGYDDDLYILFNTQDDLKSFYQSYKKPYKDFFDLKKEFNYDKYFEEAPNSKLFLAEFFKIDLNVLDFSSKSLDFIDEKMNGFFMTENFLNYISPYIVQYCGEVAKKKLKGEWDKLIFKEHWEPIIRYSNNKEFNFLAMISKHLSEQEYLYKSCLMCLFL